MGLFSSLFGGSSSKSSTSTTQIDRRVGAEGKATVVQTDSAQRINITNTDAAATAAALRSANNAAVQSRLSAQTAAQTAARAAADATKATTAANKQLSDLAARSIEETRRASESGNKLIGDLAARSIEQTAETTERFGEKSISAAADAAKEALNFGEKALDFATGGFLELIRSKDADQDILRAVVGKDQQTETDRLITPASTLATIAVIVAGVVLLGRN